MRTVASAVSASTPPRDPRKIHIPAPTAGNGPSGDRPRSRATVPAPEAQPAARRADPARRPAAKKAPARKAPARKAPAKAAAVAPAARKGRRLLPKRPRLRRVLLLTSMILPLLLLLTALGGWLYVRSAYDRVEKIPLADVLSPEDGPTNYLIVGSDTRDPQAIIDAGLNPAAFADGGGQRSDTMMLLRFEGGTSKMLSIPRDLYLPIAETDGSAKINAAYSGGGPRRLIQTVQQSLQVPVHHYMEIDFVSFAGMVDSLGGITINFPNPAFDRNTGLDITTAGPNVLDGPTALAYVRSRHYVETIDGRNKQDPTSDLGRVQRQQAFLKAVFAELGDARNPITLARTGAKASEGIRIDDTLGLTDALRLAWRLRSLDPTSVELPTRLGNNRAGSVLFKVDPDAEVALSEFR